MIHSRGITCLDSRCTPSCYLIKYDIQLKKAMKKRTFTSNIKILKKNSSNVTYFEENHVTNALLEHGDKVPSLFIFHDDHGKNIVCHNNISV